jgi:phage FluMu protein gp41
LVSFPRLTSCASFAGSFESIDSISLPALTTIAGAFSLATMTTSSLTLPTLRSLSGPVSVSDMCNLSYADLNRIVALAPENSTNVYTNIGCCRTELGAQHNCTN